MSVPRWSLPGSTNAQLKVIASDGVRSTAAASETFALTDDLAPTVDLLTPGAGQVFTGEQAISFAAQANDVEDGRLDGAAVQWSSDRDGPLGTGARLPWRADQLSEGEHVITVTARDSAGQTSTATVRITVQRVTPPKPASPYTFGGFEAPVETPGPTRVKAGSTLPLKWSISGPGVNAGTVTSARFLSDGASYKMVKSGPHWHLNVQTPKTWAATTQIFRITLVDGSTYEAEFTLK